MNKFKLLSISMFWGLMMPTVFSCGNSNMPDNTADSTKIDTLLAYFQKIDSMQNGGILFHLDVYDIGYMDGITIEVQNLRCEDEQLQYVNFRKLYGSSYYSEYVNSRMLPGEIKYLINAIDSISKEYNRKVNHDERYIYITKDNIRLFAANYNFSDNKWHSSFDVDYRKKDGSISLDSAKMQQLKKYMLESQAKIDSIRKAK